MKDVSIIFTDDPMGSAVETADRLIEDGIGVTVLKGGDVVIEVDGADVEKHITINVVPASGVRHETCEVCDWARYDPGFLQGGPAAGEGLSH